MPYVARIDGDTVVELRNCALSDIAQSERGAWRSVVEQSQAVDSAAGMPKVPELSVSDGLVTLNWGYAPPPPAWLAMRLKSIAASKRWQKEVGGITVGGLQVPTDDTAQRKISELRRRVEAGEISAPFMFKSTSGWFALDKDAIIAVDRAIATHIQACYTAEKAVADGIDNGTIASSAAIEAFAWPSGT